MIPGYVFVKVRNWLEIRRDKTASRVINYYLFGWYVMSSAPQYVFLRLWQGWFFRIWFSNVAGRRALIGFYHNSDYDHQKRGGRQI